MPAILIEVAFMDRQSPDNNALKDENFKKLVAEAIVLGICDYYGVSCANVTDSTPPTTTPTPTGTPGAAGWYRSDVTVTLSATDNSGGTGVQQIWYKLDGQEHTINGASTSVPVSGDGTHIVYYKAKDIAGNPESEKQLPVRIDKTAPTGAMVINNNASVSNATLVYLNTTASDALSGLSQMRFRDSGGTWGSWQPFSSAALWQLPVASGQTATVEAQFQDRAGNQSAVYSDSIPLNLYPARPDSSGYTLARSTFGVSGGSASSTGYKLGGTWGQPSAVSRMSSAGYRAQWGYWQASIPQPQAAFTGSPTSGVAPLAVSFTNNSSNYTGSLWAFGDGQTSTLAAPSHTYASTGAYTVSLKVTGPGGSHTLTRTNYITVTAPPTNGPVLSIPANIPASVGQPVQVPVQFTPNGATIASTVFSIDYDHTCLTFDPTDSDGDGIPNAISFNLPAAFAGGVVVDNTDSAGELDFTIIDSLPPLASLPGQTVATITFTPKAACQPSAGVTRTVAVNFAAQPAASFGSTGGGSVPGSTVNGSVSLSSVRPGDGNCDNQVDAGDLSALVLEIFDGDGHLPGDVSGGSFPGCPGADANQDNKVDAGDLTCTVLRIFGGSCGGATALEVQPLAGPGLTLPSQLAARPGETVTVPVQYAANGNAISSLVFSLDIDPTWLTFDPTDANADGLPDAVQVSLPAGFDVSVIYDPTDTDGEVDISILDPLAPLATLPDGQLMSLTFTAGAADTATETALTFSVDPPLSFGSTGGASVAGSGTPGSVLIEAQQKVYLPVIIK
jgi:PKD repeat protein